MGRQLEIGFRSHGGKRRGAGRKPVSERSGVAHRARESFRADQPLLVTLRVERSVWNLRRKKTFAVIQAAIDLVNASGRLGIVEYSVLGSNLHLIVEATDDVVLSRGMQGLTIRLARILNKLMGRTGKVFRDRFHSQVLETPREIKNALVYVLGDARRHGLVRGVSRSWVDPYSSAPTFNGWRRRVAADMGVATPTVPARTWLLRQGWRRYGLLDPSYVPG